MSKSDQFHRREFLSLFPCAILGSRFSGLSPLSLYSNQTVQELKEELTFDELKRVEKSVMAQELKAYFGEGYSCAESLLMVSLRFLGKSEDLVWAACGFGGGMYHKDLCGFLTGGFMAIGLSAGMLEKDRKERKEICGGLVKEYWKWWGSQAPLHCSEIRKPGTNAQVCRRIGLLASAKIEELIKSL